jgi:hypothetical protein
MTETTTQQLFREASEAASWADLLSSKERAVLARMLARACHRFYNMPGNSPRAMYSQIIASAEMSDLHMDVTERAAWPRREEVTK